MNKFWGFCYHALMKENILEKKYSDLPGSKPVERAVRKEKRSITSLERKEGRRAPHTKEERIQAYLDRLDHIVDSERGWELLKHKLVNELSIDTSDHDTLEKVAHALYESEKELAIAEEEEAPIFVTSPQKRKS